jgi:hypothetical protein
MHQVSENFSISYRIGASTVYGYSARLTALYLIRDAQWGLKIKRIDTATIKVISTP